MIPLTLAILNEQFDTFIDRRHAGNIFYNTARISGVVPQIALVFGASPAGSAYLPALCDFVVMVDKKRKCLSWFPADGRNGNRRKK